MQSTANKSIARIVKCAISLGVFAGSNLTALFSRITGKPLKRSCVILYYHSVPAEQRARFARQLDVLLRYSRLIDATSAVELQNGIHYAGITFDDAFENFISCALPELSKRRIPSTMFVISKALGKAFGPVGSAEKVMSMEQLRALPADLVTIGSHTETHPYMPDLDESNARRELALSKASLEHILNREITTFSFPSGGFTTQLVEMCHELGYRRVFTTLPFLAFAVSNEEFAVGRVRVDPTDWPIEFRLKLAGAYRWLPRAIEWKRKLRSRHIDARKPSKPALPRSMIQETAG